VYQQCYGFGRTMNGRSGSPDKCFYTEEVFSEFG
jgi:hypothetical protein